MAQSIPTPIQMVKASNGKKTPASKGKKLLIIFIVLLVIIAIAAVIFLWKEPSFAQFKNSDTVYKWSAISTLGLSGLLILIQFFKFMFGGPKGLTAAGQSASAVYNTVKKNAGSINDMKDKFNNLHKTLQDKYKNLGNLKQTASDIGNQISQHITNAKVASVVLEDEDAASELSQKQTQQLNNVITTAQESIPDLLSKLQQIQSDWQTTCTEVLKLLNQKEVMEKSLGPIVQPTEKQTSLVMAIQSIIKDDQKAINPSSQSAGGILSKLKANTPGIIAPENTVTNPIVSKNSSTNPVDTSTSSQINSTPSSTDISDNSTNTNANDSSTPTSELNQPTPPEIDKETDNETEEEMDEKNNTPLSTSKSDTTSSQPSNITPTNNINTPSTPPINATSKAPETETESDTETNKTPTKSISGIIKGRAYRLKNNAAETGSKLNQKLIALKVDLQLPPMFLFYFGLIVAIGLIQLFNYFAFSSINPDFTGLDYLLSSAQWEDGAEMLLEILIVGVGFIILSWWIHQKTHNLAESNNNKTDSSHHSGLKGDCILYLFLSGLWLVGVTLWAYTLVLSRISLIDDNDNFIFIFGSFISISLMFEGVYAMALINLKNQIHGTPVKGSPTIGTKMTIFYITIILGGGLGVLLLEFDQGFTLALFALSTLLAVIIVKIAKKAPFRKYPVMTFLIITSLIQIALCGLAIYLHGGFLESGYPYIPVLW